ncbi:lytic transglycosylase, partial [Nocardia sp. NPDC057455]
MAYAANVLSWSAAYRSGGSPTQVRISPDLIPPGASASVDPGSAMTAVTTAVPAPVESPRAPAPAPRPQAPTQVMITLPGLPPIPCGIFCPPPPPVDPCVAQPVPAPMPQPGQPGTARIPLAPGQPYGAGQLPDPGTNSPEADGNPDSDAVPADVRAAECTRPQTDAATGPAPDAPELDTERRNPEPASTTPPAPEPEPEPVPDAPPTPTPQPGITLPFGIVIPLPGPFPPPPAG